MEKDLSEYEFINKLKSLSFVEEIFLFGLSKALEKALVRLEVYSFLLKK